MRPRGRRGANGGERAAALKPFLVTGCSGGGKSTLIDALARRGFGVVREPGRRLISQGIAPWNDPLVFLRAAERMARADLASLRDGCEPVFCDRGLIDALAGIERLAGARIEAALGGHRPYAECVFFAEPWPELFENEEERRHSFAEAVEETEHLRLRLDQLGYAVCPLPQAGIHERTRFVLDHVGHNV